MYDIGIVWRDRRLINAHQAKDGPLINAWSDYGAGKLSLIEKLVAIDWMWFC